IMTMVVVLVGVVALLVDSVWRFRWLRDNRDRNEGGGILSIIGILMIILAPLVANLIKFAVSRQREFLADASAAYITRYPKGLVDALSKIAHDDLTVPNPSAATAHLYFSNPLENIGSKVSNLFSTHPPVEERIRRLQQM
ncbi:M48 family metalloprotease, partial [candidate division WWE3 bacterium]|nr:M48 family metalloprotease [candidate division WWE3 bacterium]